MLNEEHKSIVKKNMVRFNTIAIIKMAASTVEQLCSLEEKFQDLLWPVHSYRLRMTVYQVNSKCSFVPMGLGSEIE
ncbi:hypothetical protein PVAP13_5KG419900 [Panicum virgatum]|jgi:hypothetical protein|uniref:Uncharacterized protein n=1 Tax=Panicum virgatum TaxID=38727 RepID=A0A8T0SN39_PANVG|nr:hypothetical protein PVAP13_5KG419900 [Panicum virgatum]